MKNLYLDISGTLIKETWSSRCPVGDNVASGCLEFLECCTMSYTTYWLSSHFRYGFTDDVIEIFRDAVGERNFSYRWIDVLSRVGIAEWSDNKTDGIDFSQPFYWVDDNPSASDVKILTRYRMMDRLLIVNLHNSRNDLNRIRGLLDLPII